MNSVFHISRYITLINVIVTAIIIWLALSFLDSANQQRRESNAVLLKIAIQQDLYKSSRLLSRERELLSTIPSHAQADADSRLDDASLALADVLEEMLQHDIDRRNIMAATKESLRLLADDKVYNAQRLYVQTDLTQNLIEYEAQNTRLDIYRAYLSSQMRAPADQRVSSVYSSFHRTLNDINQQLMQISDSIGFIPTQNGPTTTNYLAFILEAWETLENIMIVGSTLSIIDSKQQPLSAELLSKLATLEYAITKNWKNLNQRAKAKHMDAELSTQLAGLENFYKDTFLHQGSRILARSDNPEVKGPTLQEWLETTQQIEGDLAALTTTTYNKIATLAKSTKSHAQRYLLVNIAVVIFCLCIAICSLLISRKIRHQAYHDSLTGLSNRSYLESHLQAIQLNRVQQPGHMAIVFIDLDRFKSINDNYGHAVGDKLLKVVSDRLLARCHSSDVVARLGGDEFAILLKSYKDRSEVEFFAEKVVQKIEEDITIGEVCVSVGASAGISLAPDDCHAGLELLKNADIAMYHGKENKIQNVYSFNTAMAEKYRSRLETEQDLKRGIEQGQFSLNYQPKICVLSGTVKSVEALLRWNHPIRGFVSPYEFVPIAEETGLMASIGNWVLDKACADAVSLSKQGFDNVSVAVNISAQQFSDEQFYSNVIDTLDRYDLAPSRLELEVTESLLMNNMDRVITTLQKLKDFGISIAIDDFGTGFSSLQYLQNLPLNVLKIDRAFVKTLDDNPMGNSVAYSIVQLAQSLNLETVAEGVETAEQDRHIREMGVNHIQGYLYSKPVQLSSLISVIEDLERHYGQPKNIKAA